MLGRTRRSEANRSKRFMSYATKQDTGCWEWSGLRMPKGYGRFGWSSTRGMLLAHRCSWMIFRGDLPSNLCVCHKCDNPPCVNPEHLFLGTKSDNTQDMLSKGRAKKSGMPGENNPAARLTAEQVAAIRGLKSTGMTQRARGKLFNVSDVTVSLIDRGVTWR